MHDLTKTEIKVGDILIFRSCYRVLVWQDDGLPPERFVRVVNVNIERLWIKDDVFPRPEDVAEKYIPKSVSTIDDEYKFEVDILRVPSADDVMREIESFAQTMRNAARAAKAHDQQCDPAKFEQWSEYILRLAQYWKRRGRHILKEALTS